MALNIALPMGAFMTIMFLIGVGLIYMSFKIAESASIKTCEDLTVQRCIRGLLVMSVMILSVSLTYMICGCGMVVSHNAIGVFFIVFMLTISISIMVLCSFIYKKCVVSRENTKLLLSLSILITAFAALYLGGEVYYILSRKFGSTSKPGGAIEMRGFGNKPADKAAFGF
jgi:uncharacterized membrane protein